MPKSRSVLVAVLASLLAWSLLIALQAIVLHRDLWHAGVTLNRGDIFTRLIPSLYVCAALFGAGFAYVFASAPNVMLTPSQLVKHMLLLFLVFLPLTACSAVVIACWSAGKAMNLFWEELAVRENFSWWLDAAVLILSYVSQVSYATWRRHQAQKIEWENTQVEACEMRLRLLHGQLKPHFLFNALNSISALVRTAERQLAVQALMQLETLLAYVVHAGGHETQSVAAEIAFSQCYVDLQMLRYGDRIDLHWQIDESVDWTHLACPVMLFQPLLENAIVHGVESHHGRSEIHIFLNFSQTNIEFKVQNTLPSKSVERQGHGIGLSATRERLTLLYEAAARLELQACASHFSASLVIPHIPYDT